MKCPFCKTTIKQTRVVDTRETPTGIRRRRECEQCGQRFTTYERIASPYLLVIKQDKRRENFNKEKLIKSMQIACTKRPIATYVLEELADKIEEKIQDMGKREVQSSEIGELVMVALKDTDAVAYVRFASVYRRFQDVDSIAAEIEQLQADRRRESSSND